MAEIRVLDNATVNKIAAGEVVERPGSVVKELCENAVDAGASAISVEIRDGGTTYIKVTDNGCGIEKSQVKTAFIRHSTSKILKVEDLDEIVSMGFRGEALASIAAVSQAEMVTRTADSETGIKILLDGGEILSSAEAPAGQGTSVTVKNLFHNVPARRKFLKKPSAEAGYISDVVTKLALGHPEISFKYINNGTVIFHTPGNNDLKLVFYSIFGKDSTMKTLPLEYRRGEYAVSGLIGRPELVRANRGYENIYINGRFIRNELISSAVEEAYKTRLPIGRFPVFVLDLAIPPSMVDVNVHPAKLETRFSNEREIYDFFYEAVFKALKDQTLIPTEQWPDKASGKKNEEEKTEPQAFIPEPSFTPAPKSGLKNDAMEFMKPYVPPKEGVFPESFGKASFVREERFEPEEDIFSSLPTAEITLEDFREDNSPEEKKFFRGYRIIGQIFATYWLVEQGGSIYLIDQHAAHERILFEELSKSYREKSVISQRLLTPVPLNLTFSEKQKLSEITDLFSGFGFDFEETPGGNFSLSSVPYIFKDPSGTGFLTDLLDMIKDATVKSVYDAMEHEIATQACKAAVKAHDRLRPSEAESMIRRLMELENPFTCPHGRPTIIEMTKYDLEKLFKRVQ